MAELSLSDLIDVEHPRQIWIISFAHGVNEFYGVALSPVIPLLVSDIPISYGQAGGLLTVFFVMYSIFQLPSGFIADRIGQVRLLCGGMVLLSLGLFIVGTAEIYRWLVVGQAISGIGGSTYHPSGMSLISDMEDSSTEGRAMGIHSLGGITEMGLSPVLVGGTAAFFGWRRALYAGRQWAFFIT